MGGSEGFLARRAGQDVARGILIGSVGKVCVRQASPRWNAVTNSGDRGGSLLGEAEPGGGSDRSGRVGELPRMGDRGWAPRVGPLGLRPWGRAAATPAPVGAEAWLPARHLRSSWASCSLSVLSDPSLAEGHPWALGVPPSRAEEVGGSTRPRNFVEYFRRRTQECGSDGWGRD